MDRDQDKAATTARKAAAPAAGRMAAPLPAALLDLARLLGRQAARELFLAPAASPRNSQPVQTEEKPS